MSIPQRPTAESVIKIILEAFHTGHEPLWKGEVIVPTRFTVYLQPDAFDELERHIDIIRKKSRQLLDQALDAYTLPLWLQWWNRLVVQMGKPEWQQQRTGHRNEDYWYIEFMQKWDFDIRLDYVAVMADFPKGKDKKRFQGGLTRRLTLMSADGHTLSMSDPSTHIKEPFDDGFQRKTQN
jgi:hypothetical protein